MNDNYPPHHVGLGDVAIVALLALLVMVWVFSILGGAIFGFCYFFNVCGG